MKSCVCLYESKKTAGTFSAVVRTIVDSPQGEHEHRFGAELYDDVHLFADEYAFSFSNFTHMIYTFPAYTIFHHRKNGMKAVFVDDQNIDLENLPDKWRMVAVASPCFADVRSREEFHVVIAITTSSLSRDAHFFIFGEYPEERVS